MELKQTREQDQIKVYFEIKKFKNKNKKYVCFSKHVFYTENSNMLSGIETNT